MDKLTDKARATVERIRESEQLTEADVFVSPGGDALVWVSEDVILHVATTGVVYEAAGEWDGFE